MKIRRNLYLVLGVLAIFFYIGGTYVIFTVFKRVTPAEIQSANFQLITGHIWLIIAVLFFRAAYRIQKKINDQKRQALINTFTD